MLFNSGTLANPCIRFVSITALLVACGDVTGGNPSEGAAESRDALFAGARPIQTFAFPEQAAPFTLDVDAATGNDVDVLLALSRGEPQTYTDLGAILRFNPAGQLDARDGGVYRAASAVPYGGYEWRRYRYEVDPTTRRYSVSLLAPEGVTTIGRDFAFRSEQAATASLDHLSMIRDAGDGWFQDAVLGEACHSVAPGAGFWNLPLGSENTAFTAAFSATPAAAGIDGVIGMFQNPARTFDDLAFAVRFNPDGFIDARDGDTYRAVETIPYAAGTRYDFKLIVDVFGHAYSATVNDHVLAKNFAFRTSRQYDALMNGAVAIADSDVGGFEVCDVTHASSPRVTYLHDLGHYEPTLFTDTTSLVGTRDSTLLVAGPTRTSAIDHFGNVIPSVHVEHGGALALDYDDNRFLFGEFAGSYDAGGETLASAGGRDLYATKYDRNWNLVYATALGGAEDEELSGYAVNRPGQAVVRSGAQLFWLDAQGVTGWTRTVEAAADTSITIGDDGAVFFAENSSAGFGVEKLDAAGETEWRSPGTAYDGHARLTALRATPDGGVVFAGNFNGSLVVAGSTIAANTPDRDETFIVKLDHAGELVFGTYVDINSPPGLSVDEAGHLTVTGSRYNPTRFRIERFNADGSRIDSMGGHEILNGFERGTASAPIFDAGGQVYVLLNVALAGGDGTRYLLRLASP
jgi:hypothetical protein